MSDSNSSSSFLIRCMTVCGIVLVTGCGSLTGPSDPASESVEPLLVPGEETGWVRLEANAVGPPPGAPVWPIRNGGGSQSDGMATIIQELDLVARLVDTVRRMPEEPGEFRINWTRIQADIAAVRAGLVEALLGPPAAPGVHSPVLRDYLE